MGYATIPPTLEILDWKLRGLGIGGLGDWGLEGSVPVPCCFGPGTKSTEKNGEQGRTENREEQRTG